MLMRRIARPLLAAAFVGQAVEALRRPQQAAQTARPTFEGLQQLPEEISARVPNDLETFAKAIAVAQISGAALLASGKLPRVAAAVLACTVIPGSAGGHLFWTETDPQRRAQQRQALLTDVSLIGGLMIAASDTAGKPSLGWQTRRTARRIYRNAASALPTNSGETALDTVGDKVSAGLHAGAEHGRELAGLALEKAGPLLEAATERGTQLAEAATERGAQLAEVAVDRGTDLAQAARENAVAFADTARRRLRR